MILLSRKVTARLLPTMVHLTSNETQYLLCVVNGVPSWNALPVFLHWIVVLICGSILSSFLEPHSYASAGLFTGDWLKSTLIAVFPEDRKMCQEITACKGVGGFVSARPLQKMVCSRVGSAWWNRGTAQVDKRSNTKSSLDCTASWSALLHAARANRLGLSDLYALCWQLVKL